MADVDVFGATEEGFAVLAWVYAGVSGGEDFAAGGDACELPIE